MDDILHELSTISTSNALDVATGDGLFIRLLMKTLNHYTSFIGIDISQKHLNAAVRKSRRDVTQFIKMDSNDLHFPDDSFDLVSISESLHHLESPLGSLKEINRVLHPNGIFLLHESISDKNQAKSSLSDVLLHEFIAKNDILRDIHHRGFFESQDIVGFLRKTGFSDIKLIIAPYPIKCALCKYLPNCTEAMSSRMINKGLREISRSLKKVKSYPGYPTIKKKASKLRKVIRENGYTPAASVFILARI
jgi:ubiquinone/menaquinone biosynthesis C-methylase UbiE